MLVQPETSEPLLPSEDPAEILIGRRTAERLAVRVPARFRLGTIEADVVVSDISATGARLQMPCPPRAGVEGVLHWQGIDCACRVVWSGKESFGVAFNDTLALSEELAKGARIRKAPCIADTTMATATLAIAGSIMPVRPAIQRPAEIRQGEGWVKVVLRGISRHGFEVGWFPRCREASPISLRGAGLPLLRGRVVSTDHVVVKCRLREPLHDAVLQHISAELGLVP